MCGLFAATYPERTSALIMVASYPRMMAAPGYTFGRTQEQLDELFAEIAGNGAGRSALRPAHRVASMTMASASDGRDICV